MNVINDRIFENLKSKLVDLEALLNADVLSYYGSMVRNELEFLQIVEQLANTHKHEVLYIILNTTGGDAIAVERYVNIIRHHYKEVNFIIPDYAYSAGTIFCMSGNNIYMDYYSVLGPIDPQVTNKDGKMVPALGYLDKINDLIEKAQKGTLTQPEFIILKEFDLAELRFYEQAKELTIDLLKKWLVKYKFSNWNMHKNGTSVSDDEKIKRAEEIAEKLGNNNIWKSHARSLNIDELRNMKLKIENFGEKPDFSKLIREYHFLTVDFLKHTNMKIFVLTREM